MWVAYLAIQWWTEIETCALLFVFASPELGLTDDGKYRVTD